MCAPKISFFAATAERNLWPARDPFDLCRSVNMISSIHEHEIVNDIEAPVSVPIPNAYDAFLWKKRIPEFTI